MLMLRIDPKKGDFKTYQRIQFFTEFKIKVV